MPTVTGLLVDALKVRRIHTVFAWRKGLRTAVQTAFSDSPIQLVDCPTAAVAARLAASTARLSGQLQVCLFAGDAEAVELVGALHAADLDRAPVLAVHAGPGRLSEASLALLSGRCRRVTRVSEGMGAMQVLTALAAMQRGLPGPVLVDLSPVADHTDAGESSARWGLRRKPLATADVGHASERLADARRVVVLVGADDRSVATANGVRRLVNAAGAVVFHLPQASGVADPDHGLYAGPLSWRCDVRAHQQAIFDDADLLLAVGLSSIHLPPGWDPGWSDRLPIVSLDAHPPSFSLPGCVVDELAGPLMELLDRLRVAAFGPAPEDDPDACQAHPAWSEERVQGVRHAWVRAEAGNALAALVRAVQAPQVESVRVCVDAARPLAVRTAAPKEVLACQGPLATLAAAIASRRTDPKTPVVAVLSTGLPPAAAALPAAVGSDLVVVFQGADPGFAGLYGATAHRVEGPKGLRQAVARARQAGGLHLIGVEAHRQ